MDISLNKKDLLTVENLKKHFPIRKGLAKRTVGFVYAVDGVSFSIRRGETLGLVGESGCGKSTLGRCLVRLHKPTDGRIFFEGKDLGRISEKEIKSMRMRLQMIFQDPYASLNPRMRIRDIVGEAIRVHGRVRNGNWRDRVRDLLSEVGLDADHMARYPHEFSGGQRQRIGIARALAMEPSLIVADEPVSALDVSTQAQIINLLDALKEKRGLSLLIIAHDLAIVEHISDRIAVMYLGMLVEMASDRELYLNPQHPYSRALLAAVPKAEAGAKKRRRRILLGDVPSPINPPPGCRFHPRCPDATNLCRKERPPVIRVAEEHWVRCFLYA
jgi:oligopeptide transport system ATP-binding protein